MKLPTNFEFVLAPIYHLLRNKDMFFFLRNLHSLMHSTGDGVNFSCKCHDNHRKIWITFLKLKKH